jgi:SAM-dependent methyltransferase
MGDHHNYFETNRHTWNKKVKVHSKSEMYQLEAFKRGVSSLNSYELQALGDVSGKSLLHLQCHFGQDTLSWSRLGAKCVGVDISDEGIKLASELNTELDLDAEFIRCNILDIPNHITRQFDIVFTSYGVIGWLPDLKPWAQIIADRLRPGGVFYMVEFHPILWMFDYQGKTPEMKYHYIQDEVIHEVYDGTYADKSSSIRSEEYGWNHGLGEVITALSQAGLRIDYLKEHDKSPYDVFPDLIPTEDGMYQLKKQLFPMIFEVRATKI